MRQREQVDTGNGGERVALEWRIPARLMGGREAMGKAGSREEGRDCGEGRWSGHGGKEEEKLWEKWKWRSRANEAMRRR